MRNEQRGRVAGQLADRAHDVTLLRRIEAGGRLVEDQDRRAADERAGERDPLPLAARERAPALGQDGVVSIG